jgi:hypothetical protein
MMESLICETQSQPSDRASEMLTKRIIPCLDVKEGRVVKGVSFVNLRDTGDPVEVAVGRRSGRAVLSGHHGLA